MMMMMVMAFALVLCSSLLFHVIGFRVMVKNADGQLVPNGTYFKPYDKGFVGKYGDARNYRRERINEGAYQTSDQELLNEGVEPRQQCPNMVGPFSDGSFYCTAREFGYCDRRSGTCFCNAGYKGIDCSDCEDSHYRPGSSYHCFPKKLCPLDCSGAGQCDHNSGVCSCLPHRTGLACETLLCTKHSALCETCTTSVCLKCASGYYLTGGGADDVCGPCRDFDPRCSGCTRELGCTECADSVLTSVRRSGYRKPADPDLPSEEIDREFGIAWPFGTKSADSFADAEYYFVCTTPLTPLNNNSISCIQGQRNDDSWDCTPFQTSHRVCGHYGVFTFVYPNYEIAEKGKSITMQVRRTGGGYGNVTINYFIKHFTTNDSDLVATAHYTTNQRLTFNQGVIQRSFKINILDDNIVEENEVFQVVLEVPEGGGSVGAQFRTNVTIIDDDAPLISAKLSKILQNTTSLIAGQSFAVGIQAVAADGMQLTMGGERFLAIIENDLSMWNHPPTASQSQRNSYRKTCSVEDNGDGTYEANCPTIVEQGVYQLRIWHCLRGIWGEYFYDGFFDRLAVQRLDHSVDFTWGVGKLIPRGKDYVSIRWTGAILSNQTGSYQFKVDANDNARLWIDGQLLIDHFHEKHVDLEPARTIHLLSNTVYELVLEYRELTGDAYAHLMWSYEGGPAEVIPETSLYALFEVDRSPVLVTVFSTDTAPDKTECTGDGLYEGRALHTSYFSFCPRDRYRNLRDDLDLFYLSSDLFSSNLTLLSDMEHGGVGSESLVPHITYNSNTHCFDASYTPSIAGQYQLEIVHETTRGEGRRVHVAGSPFFLTVGVGKMSGPKSLVHGLPSMLYMEAGRCRNFTIVARDNAQNYLFFGGNSIQVYMFQVDHYSIEAGVPVGSPLSQRPGSHTIAPRPSDQIQDVVRDGSVYDHSNGTYTAQICPVIAGIHEVHVLLNGKGVSNQHFQILNMAQSIQQPLGAGTYFGEYIASSPYYLVVSHTKASAFTSTAVGKGIVSSHPQVVGIPTSFMVTVRDPFYNVLRTSTPSVSVTATLDRSPNVVLPIWDYRNGSFEVEYTPLLAGLNTVSVYIDGSLMRHSPFSFNVSDGRTSANYSFAVGKGLYTGRSGDVSYFQVYAFDLNNNRKSGYDDDYRFVVSGSNNITGSLQPCPIAEAATYHPVCGVDDRLAGHYFGFFTPYINGEITVSVYLVHAGQQHQYQELFNSPFTARVVPSDPKAELSDVSGTLYDTTAGVPSSVGVHLRDYFHNSLQSGGYSLEIALLGVAVEWGTTFPLPENQGLPNQYHYRGFYKGYPDVYGTAMDNLDGSYSLMYTVDQAGQYVMRLALAESGLNATYYNDTSFGYLFDEDFNLVAFDTTKQGLPVNTGSSVSWTGDLGRRPGLRGDLGEGTYLKRYISRLEKNISVDLRMTNMNNYFNNNNDNDDDDDGNKLYKFRDEHWSARWTGMITPEAAEVYRFTFEVDDASSVSLRIGGRGLETNNSEPGELVIAANRNEVLSGYYNFTDTNYRELEVKYIHYTGDAVLSLYWESLTTSKRLVPSTAFSHWRNISHYNTTIHPNSLCSSCSTVYGEALTNAQVAVKKSFLLYARDVYGNLLEVGGDQPTMLAVGKDGAAFRGVVTDYGNSTYLIEYFPTQAGVFFMYVTVGCCVVSTAVGHPAEIQLNAHLQVQGSPFLLTIAPAPVDQTRCIATGTGLLGGVVGATMDFTVYYRDIYNNPTTADAGDGEQQRQMMITVTIVEQDSNTTISPIDLQILYGSSNSTIQYTLNRSGKYLLYVYLSIQSINNTIQHKPKQIIASPFQVTMHASKAVAAHTICRGVGLRQAGMSKNPSSFEIQLYDAFRNPLIMGGNRFYTRLQGDASFLHSTYVVAPACQDHQNGRTTCTYRPLYDGQHQLIIRLLNNSISSPGGLGLTGYYYSSRDGAVDGDHGSAYIRIDSRVSFYWDSGLIVPSDDETAAVLPGPIPLTDAGQSIRWVGYLLSPRSDVFRVVARASNMDVSVYIDDNLVFDSIADVEEDISFVLDSTYAIRIIAIANADYQTQLADGSVVHSMLPMSIDLRWSTLSIQEYSIPRFFLYDSADDIAYSPFPVVVVR